MNMLIRARNAVNPVQTHNLTESLLLDMCITNEPGVCAQVINRIDEIAADDHEYRTALRYAFIENALRLKQLCGGSSGVATRSYNGADIKLHIGNKLFDRCVLTAMRLLDIEPTLASEFDPSTGINLLTLAVLMVKKSADNWQSNMSFIEKLVRYYPECRDKLRTVEPGAPELGFYKEMRYFGNISYDTDNQIVLNRNPFGGVLAQNPTPYLYSLKNYLNPHICSLLLTGRIIIELQNSDLDVHPINFNGNMIPSDRDRFLQHKNMYRHTSTMLYIMAVHRKGVKEMGSLAMFPNDLVRELDKMLRPSM